MTTIAYMALHYGKDYIYWSIKSVINYVDKFYVLYSPVGSHGSRTDVPCPDSRAELYKLAEFAARDKLVWIDGEWGNEGAQRMSIHDCAPAADVIFVVDADEIWPNGLAHSLVDMHNRFAPTKAFSTFRIPMIHLWRSFSRAITDDKAYPVRAIFPKFSGLNEHGTFHHAPIVHAGYAQNAAIVEYKQHTHGHRAEWRANWYQDRFLVNAQHDCHPVNIDYWNPVAVDPWDYLPQFMRHHPYADKELIE